MKQRNSRAVFSLLMSVATGFVQETIDSLSSLEVGITQQGIFSKRLNGLCAFNAVPTPEELDDFEDEEVQVRSGTYTGTIKSIFCVSSVCASSRT